DVDAVDELEARQQLEGAVDAGQADAAAGLAQLVVDLLRRQQAALAVEQREHLLAGARLAVPGARELALGVLHPGHDRMVALRTVLTPCPARPRTRSR